MRNLEENTRHEGCTQGINDAEKSCFCCNVNDFFDEYTSFRWASCSLLLAKSM